MPADFGRLCDDVVLATNRPELIGEIQLAVRQATKHFHMKDFFMRDAMEDIISFPFGNYNFQIDVTQQLTRFRKVRFIKKYDPATGLLKDSDLDKLIEADPDRLFDRYGAQRNNIYYMGGDMLNIRSNTQESAFLVSWYAYPDTLPESYKSWIADLYDVIIVEKAKARILRSIGMTDDANRIDQEVETIHWPIVLANDVQVKA